VSETLDEERERIEGERRAASAARVAKMSHLHGAADKFFGFVYAHSPSPDVAQVAAELLVIAAALRRRDLEFEKERLKID
jgi:hypothetical protein